MDNNNPITGTGQPQPQPQPEPQPEPQPQPETQAQPEVQPESVVQPTSQPAEQLQQPAAQPQPTTQPQPTKQPAIQPQPATLTANNTITNPQPTAPAPNIATTPNPSPAAQKVNGKLIAIIVALAAVIIAIVVTLIVVFAGNSSKPSNNKDDNTGNNHFENDDDDQEKDDDDTPPSTVGSTISCLGYSFNKLSGYDYDCQIDSLTIQDATFITALKEITGLSYSQAEGQADALAEALSKTGADITSYRPYTASTGKKMLVFNATYEGVNIYFYITAASSTSILNGLITNQSGSPSNSDLEIVADILGASTVASRLPEEDPEEASKELPTIDWAQYLKVPEFTK